ncbi:hypothetical protein EZ481_00010 [Streptococcus pneumoniae]|nr:hypothetical protein EZ481_00010 [Streptococcus pneumoniae]
MWGDVYKSIRRHGNLYTYATNFGQPAGKGKLLFCGSDTSQFPLVDMEILKNSWDDGSTPRRPMNCMGIQMKYFVTFLSAKNRSFYKESLRLLLLGNKGDNAD